MDETFYSSPGAHTQDGFDVERSAVLPKIFIAPGDGVHGHAVGQLVAFSAYVGTDMVELYLWRDASVHSVGLLNDAQILDLTTGLSPTPGLPAMSPLGNAVDGVDGIAKKPRAEARRDVGLGHEQRMMQSIELRGIVGAVRIIEAVPELYELAVPVNDDTRARVTRIGIAGAVAVDLHALGVHGRDVGFRSHGSDARCRAPPH